jgi:hypothetical protein
MRGRLALVAGVIASIVCVLAPTPAGASQTIGMTMFPTLDIDAGPPDPMNCLREAAPQSDTATLIQFARQAGSLPLYTVPAGGGVVTSWSHMAPDPIGFAETMALQMLRPAGGTQFTVIGQSAVQSIFIGLNSFPTRIPVQAGDVIGVYVQHGGNVAYCQEAAPTLNLGDRTREINATQNPAVGTTLDFVGNEQSARLDVAAVVEPDRDGDGFGDETQDPSTPSSPDSVAPDTTLSGKKRVKAKKKTAKAKFTLTSDDAGATFMCRLDAKPFAPCTSPAAVKAKVGTHVFTAVASDAQGNADPTAAAKQFKVVRAK